MMFWSVEVLIVVAIIWVCTKIGFMFKPLGIFASTIFIPILVAGILFYILNPLVDLLTKVKISQHKKISRTWAVAIIFLLFIGLIALAAVFFVPKVITQFATMINNFPAFIDTVQKWANKTISDLNTQSFLKTINFSALTDKFSKNITSWTTGIFSSLTNGLGGFVSTAAGVVINAITIPVVLFYMLKDGYKLGPTIEKAIPEKHRKQTMDLLNKMNRTISKYIGGQLIECLFVGTFTSIGYFIIGLPYALLLGVFAGFFNIIPYLGPYIGIAPALIVSFSNGGALLAIYNIIVVIIVQQIDGNLVYPNVIGKSLEIHPLTIIIILLAAGNIAGLMGMILAVPLYAVVKVVIIHMYNISQLE